MMDGQNKLLATVDNIQSQMSEIGDLHHKSQRIHLVLIACAGILVEASGHSNFDVVRMSNKHGDGQHARLARRARSGNGRCGPRSEHKVCA